MEVYPVDAGVIRCICGFDHDDKFTIQCEKCNVWQHAICVDIFDEAAVPDEYFCDRCGGHQHDVDAAIERQLRALRKKRKGRRSPEAEAQPEIKRRGRKKRQPEEEVDVIIDSPSSYFVATSENILLPGASEVIETASTENSEISQLSASEFARARPAGISVIRVNKGYGLGAYSVTATSSLGRDRFVIEVTGEVMPFETYKLNPVNQYRECGYLKPGVFAVPGLPLVIDGRVSGTESVFFRRSRTPNLRLSPILVGKRLHIVAFTIAPVKAGTELTISWEWDANHPIFKLDREKTYLRPPPLETILAEQELTDSEKQCLIKTYEHIENEGMADSLADCLPPAGDLEMLKPVSASLVLDKPKVLSLKTRNVELQTAFFNRTTEPSSVPSSPKPDNISWENIWIPASLKAAAPATKPVEQSKKKLSLADYKKKRPSSLSVN